MAQTFLHWLGGLGPWSYAVIFGLVFAESGLLLLLPGETVVLLAGVLASRGALSLPILMGVATISAMLGDATGFSLGRGPARRRFEARGRFLLLRASDAARVKELISQHGGLAIAGSRFVGVLRVATPFVCGLIDTPPQRFFPYNLAACLVWGTGIAGLGYLGGNAWERLHDWVGRVSLALGALFLIGLFFWIRRRRGQRPS
jgi:membrane-associated protein